ncbi:hypothetical protein C8R43DRAFT_718608 [Mycena crocata]|nr:hypothetical protein C8R43DRAFT_718608 [Mycena crocata]
MQWTHFIPVFLSFLDFSFGGRAVEVRNGGCKQAQCPFSVLRYVTRRPGEMLCMCWIAQLTCIARVKRKRMLGRQANPTTAPWHVGDVVTREEVVSTEKVLAGPRITRWWTLKRKPVGYSGCNQQPILAKKRRKQAGTS